MKTISFSFIIFLIVILSIPLTHAWWANVAPKFIAINGKICEYKKPVDNIPVAYQQSDCIAWSDSETFHKLENGWLLFDTPEIDFYIDKNALYFYWLIGMYPSFKWERIVMDTRHIRKIWWSNYFLAWNNIYYTWFELNFIKVRSSLGITINVLNKDAILINSNTTKKSSLYTNGVLQDEFDGKKVYKDTLAFYKKYRKDIVYKTYPFFVYWNSVYFSDWWHLRRIDWVDFPTFKITRSWYKDKNNTYLFEYWDSGYGITVWPKK